MKSQGKNPCYNCWMLPAMHKCPKLAPERNHCRSGVPSAREVLGRGSWMKSPTLVGVLSPAIIFFAYECGPELYRSPTHNHQWNQFLNLCFAHALTNKAGPDVEKCVSPFKWASETMLCEHRWTWREAHITSEISFWNCSAHTKYDTQVC